MLLFARTIQEDPMGSFYGICDKYIDICFNTNSVIRTFWNGNRLKENDFNIAKENEGKG